MEKVLYFEGAGCVPRGDVENCRIRTAFINDESNKIYLEMIGIDVDRKNDKRYANFTVIGFVDSCHYITGDKNDCSKNRLPIENIKFEYSKQEILKLVNTSLNCSFTEICVLNDSAGYRVHGDCNNYNFMDDLRDDKL